MKFRFEPDLDYQLQAIEAVCDLFKGQEMCSREFSVATVPVDGRVQLGLVEHGLSLGNRLALSDAEILKNLRRVQLRNGLTPTESLVSGDFTVEMETGTGKTYVYLRTILELNKRYAFSKFVIVVPSVAVKEGVYKSLQMTRSHFRALYSGVVFEYFLYDSKKLAQVRNFATSSQIEIMIVTVGAINKKDVNNLYKKTEKVGGGRPIDLIRATRPIVIVDEPQSVDGGLNGQGKRALEAMGSLCTLRYSATHVDKHQMVYRLDAVDAYERKLVKQIEVASATVEDAHNRPYVRVVSTRNRRGEISAIVEIDVATRRGGAQRREVRVMDGEDLEQVTRRTVYRDCYVGEIRVEKKNESVELRVPGGQEYLRPGEAWGDVEAGALQREMIRRTIREHLDKEKRLRPQGIKVLSLFFVDRVSAYRQYDEAGKPAKGEYAAMFEEEYKRLAKQPAYRSLFGEVDVTVAAAEVHEGYFSVDKKGGWTDTADNNQANRENAERAYSLIMKDKERLLSLETPLKFIFSHSALKEGWDNPNVFQICTLRDIRTERERRQTLGRGLRLCVNQDGLRVRGFDVNTLTVVARESYEAFADNLQREIEADTGIRFGVVEPEHFGSIPVVGENGKTEALGVQESRAIYDHLRSAGHLDAAGRIQESLRKELKADSLHLPERFTVQRAAIISILRKLAGRLVIKDAEKRRTLRPRQAVLQSREFRALWDRIKHKTMYRVHFDNDKLVDECARALRDAPVVPRSRLQWRKAGISIGLAGVSATEVAGSATVVLDDGDMELPNLLTELQDRCQLTRRSIYRVLVGSNRLGDFVRNPQQFVDIAAVAINRCKRQALVDGIKYQRVGEQSYYAQELFKQRELVGYLRSMREAKKSVYDRIVYESETEALFADELERDSAVKVYAKLPGWFTVPTPLGKYNPDWAILIDSEEGERLYLVVETKASTLFGDLRGVEGAKIECGKAHFRALGSEDRQVRYEVATSLEKLLAGLG